MGTLVLPSLLEDLDRESDLLRASRLSTSKWYPQPELSLLVEQMVGPVALFGAGDRF